MVKGDRPGEDRDLKSLEYPGKYLTQKPLIEIREYPDHIKILFEVSDNSPHTLTVKPIGTTKIELLFKYKGRNMRKRLILPDTIVLNSYEVQIKNGVARVSFRKGVPAFIGRRGF